MSEGRLLIGVPRDRSSGIFLSKPLEDKIYQRGGKEVGGGWCFVSRSCAAAFGALTATKDSFGGLTLVRGSEPL